MTTVTEIFPRDLSPLQREWNKGLMVGFINRGLPETANLDVRKSIVFYDADRDFMFATEDLPPAKVLEQLAETRITYYSKGC